MGTRKLAVALLLCVSTATPAAAQQQPSSNPEFEAERQAAHDDQLRAEKLVSAGERGPESEACRLMDSYFLHLVKAAAAVGAETRVTAWSELTSREQDAVKQKVTELWARNTRMHQVACRANP